MQKDIKIVLDIGELSIDKEIGFGINYSIDDIKDPSKRNQAFSKTVMVPGTKNNNLLMGGLFDVNADFTFFNPNVKTNAKIVVDSTTILDGFLQLKKITKEYIEDLQGDLIYYHVVLYDKVVDFMTIIGEKLLSELDFSRYDHIYNKANIEASWAHTAEDIYGYPLLYRGDEAYKVKDFKPGIFHKAYLEKIMESNLLSVAGSFMSNTDYDRDFVPFVGDIPTIPVVELDRRKFKAGPSADSDFLSFSALGGLVNGNALNFLGYHTSMPFLKWNDDSTSPNFDPNNHWNTLSGQWKIDRTGNYNTKGRVNVEFEWKTIRDLGTITDAGGGKININYPNHQFSNAQQIVIAGTTNYNGTFNIGVVDANNFTVTGTFVGSQSGTFAWEAWQQTYRRGILTPIETDKTYNAAWQYKLNMNMKRNGTNYQNYSITLNAPYVVLSPLSSPPPSTFNASNGYTSTVNSSIVINRTGSQFTVGDEIDFSWFMRGDEAKFLKYVNGISFSTAKEVPVDVRITVIKDVGANPTYIYGEPNASNVDDGDTINLNQYIPQKFKQKDIITDLIKRYNMYLTIDPDNDRKIMLQTRDDYYAAGTTLDWTDKKDYDYTDNIEILSELQNKEIMFSYKSDTDDWNKNYSESVDGDIYGQKTVEFVNEFTKGTKKVETPFSPTLLIYNSPNRVAVVPAIGTSNPKMNIRVLHYAGLKNTIQGTWNFSYLTAGSTPTPTVTAYNMYPFAGHFNDPVNPTLDLNYGETNHLCYNELANTTSNNLFNRYWRNYINQIAEGRLVTSRFWLTEVDIAFIKNNLNTKIFVKDSYYYINNIQDYDPTGDGLTVVKLLKIQSGVQFVDEPRAGTGTLTDWETVNLNPAGGRGGGVSAGGSSTGFTNDNVSNSPMTSFSGKDNYIGFNSNSSMIVGDNNTIDDNVDNSGVLGGDNNRIVNGVVNSWIIGADDKVVTQSNEVWIGDLHIVNGQVQAQYNLINGGRDTVYTLFPTSPINLINGGRNAVTNYGGQVNLENLIDGARNGVTESSL